MIWKRLFPSVKGHGDTTLIAGGAVVEGTIRFDGVLEIEGSVDGSVCARSDEHAVVRILRGGQVHGNVSAPVVVINGTVTGNVQSTDHVELAPHAVINGDVCYKLLEMSRGAQVNGRLLFNGATPMRPAGDELPFEDRGADPVDYE
ncbi:MAG: polymer-forming cytoskeletal protein [Pseudomonadales bacterium]|jgi:cytoskeletal protein CcmA (bactofilin family)|nr:polymer-forming cytoskeletal protein [Pseudomonadales bacterium]